MEVNYSLEYVNRKREAMGKSPLTENQYERIYDNCERREKEPIDILTELILTVTDKDNACQITRQTSTGVNTSGKQKKAN